MLDAGRLTVDFHRDECDQEGRAIVVRDELFGADRTHPDAKFLAKLAARRVDVGFAWFEFAARKFPESTVALVCGALADEIVGAAGNDGGEDADGRLATIVSVGHAYPCRSWLSSYCRWACVRSADCAWSRFFALRIALSCVEDDFTAGSDNSFSKSALLQDEQTGSFPLSTSASKVTPHALHL